VDSIGIFSNANTKEGNKKMAANRILCRNIIGR